MRFSFDFYRNTYGTMYFIGKKSIINILIILYMHRIHLLFEWYFTFMAQNKNKNKQTIYGFHSEIIKFAYYFGYDFAVISSSVRYIIDE